MKDHTRKTQGSSGLKTVGLGCLVIIIAIGIGVGVVMNKVKKLGGMEGAGRAIAATGLLKITDAMLEGMHIPETDRTAIMAPLETLGDQVRAGEVTMQQGEAILGKIMEGPIMGVLMAQGFQGSYLDASSLTDAEKTEARLTINRFQQGFISEKLDMETLNQLEQYVTTPGSDGTNNLKAELSDEDLKSSLAVMKSAANGASIPLSETPIDLPGLFQKAIDSGLATAAATEPALTPVDAP